MSDRNSQFTSQVSFIYGYNTIIQRKDIWNQLQYIQRSVNGAWLILGDFNTLLSVSDRVNGNLVQPSETVDFQECIDHLDLGIIRRKGC